MSSKMIYTGKSLRLKIAALSGPIILATVGVLLVWRVLQNVDLADEYYYAAFLDDWLKGGIASSTLRTLHQTAALILYPAALVHHAIVGSNTGLMLFLRGIFVLMNLWSALCWLGLFRRLGSPLSAWLAAAAVVAFVPFGLPAPSYDTLAVQGLSIGLACLAVSLMSPDRPQGRWLAMSAAGWAVATVAYPTLCGLLPLVLLAAFVLAPTDQRARLVGFLLFGQLLAWACVISVLGPERLRQSVIYVAQMEDTGGWGRKLAFSIAQFASHPVFMWSCATALACAALRAAGARWLPIAGMCVIVAVGLVAPPALYVRSHDLVVLLALYGSHLLFLKTPSGDRAPHIVAAVYVLGIFAGLLTTLSAYNSIYCFCIGGAPAAFLSLANLPRRPKEDRPFRPHFALEMLVVVAFAFSTLTYFYGDLPGSQAPRVRMPFGPYAGLALQPDQATALRVVGEQLKPLLGDARTIAEIGRLPGLMMVTAARPRMASVFPLVEDVQPAGRAWNHAFYAANPADAVLLYRDPYMPDPINPFGPSFSTLYERVAIVPAPPGTVELFRLRQPAPAALK
jgi:hypothetical protein